MSRLVDAPTPKPAKQFNPAGTPRFAAGFPFENAKGAFRGLPMLTAEKCRDRAADCQKMAERAPSARVRDILLDMGRTWTRLAFEAEQWTQTNRPAARITRAAAKNPPREPTPPTPFVRRGSRRRPDLG
jgi:hypothetical protein